MAVVTHRALSSGGPRTGFSVSKKFGLGVTNLELADFTGAERRKARRAGETVIDSALTRLARRCRHATALTHGGQGSQMGVSAPGPATAPQVHRWCQCRPGRVAQKVGGSCGGPAALRWGRRARYRAYRPTPRPFVSFDISNRYDQLWCSPCR